MHKAELCWDADHEALPAQQYYHGTAYEARSWCSSTTGPRTPASRRAGSPWTVPTRASNSSLGPGRWGSNSGSRSKRAGASTPKQCARMSSSGTHEAWEHAVYQADASIENKAVLLVRHGSEHDLGAVGR